MFEEIRRELLRLDAEIQLESHITPHLIQISSGSRSCSVDRECFLEVLKSLPDEAGESAVFRRLESSAAQTEHWAVG